MITSVDALPLLSAQVTADEAPLQGPQEGERAFMQLLFQLLDSPLFQQLDSPLARTDIQAQLAVYVQQHLQEQRNGVEEIEAEPLQDILPHVDTASDETLDDLLDRLVAVLQHVFQQRLPEPLPEEPPASLQPASVTQPVTSEAASLLPMPTQGNHGVAPLPKQHIPATAAGEIFLPPASPRPASVTQSVASEAASLLAESREAQTVDANSSLLPAPPTQGEEPLRSISSAAAQLAVKSSQASADRTWQPASELSLPASQRPDPLRPSGASAPSSHETTFAVSETVAIPPSPEGQRTTASGDSQASVAPRFSLVPPETAARLLGHPLPRHAVLLQLEPPELGHVHIQVHLTDERLAATFWAESPEVRALLRDHFPALNQTLSAQGLHPQQISISLATDGFNANSGRFSQSHSGFQPHASGTGYGTRDADADEPAHEWSASHRSVHNGLLDVVI